ncbi:DUF1740-domain-containing protein [Byssothecium circinans]|uniref:DUF1740-domain-containing protein n=1 Tax=Byssothecium circinans TaxID=147558 RepID=A0A6A5TT33_9PLEO|nr:DUF1740-domain-containing protein [Byssothecium circinans]
MATNVPKFASFRPKPKEPEQSTKESPRPEKHAKSKTSSREKEKVREKERPRDSSGREKDSRPREHDAAPSKVYFSDRRGDRDFAKYGTFNKYDVPPYRLFGYGHVLGLPLGAKIDRDRSTDKEVVITPPQGQRQKRLLTEKRISREPTRSVRFVKVTAEEGGLDADFIAIGKRKREGSDEDEDDDYRRLDRPTSVTKPSDPDAEYESETVGDADSEVTQRNAILVRRTRENPQDVQAWLDLIDHQEPMMKIDRSLSDFNSSDKQNLADIRISTYEHALKKMTTDEGSQARLYAGLMAEASRSWDELRLSNKWTEILSKFPACEQLWIQYLDFVQSSFTTFKYENCRTTFFKCLKTLYNSEQKGQKDFVLHVFVRLTSMIHQAGYQELALAVWQALLEFQLLRPKSLLNESLKECLRSFEEFWDSEVARIGEEGAAGWEKFDQNISLPPPPGNEPIEAPATTATNMDDFCKQEVENESKLRYPGRTTDELGEDDPFHTVLFSDIEEFLTLVPQDTPAKTILNALLYFCGLPPIQVDNDMSGYPIDPLLQCTFAKTSFDGGTSDTLTQIMKRYSSVPVQSWQSTTELLFTKAFPTYSGVVEAVFIRRLLKLLAFDVPADEALGEYLLALESQYFPTEAQKTAKKLLKARPSSLRLYNAYALAESRGGNSAKADQVFSAALSMQKDNSPFSTPGSLELFNNWVWEALRQGKSNEALQRLVSPTGKIVEETVPQQATLLRTRTVLSELTERSLLGNDFPSAVTSTSLSALLAYLSNNQNVDIALNIHTTLAKWFTSHALSQSPAAELHAQAIAHFLAHHATHARIVKPSLLRTTLEPLLASFPNNTILLSLYAANEARFSIDDRVRDMLHNNVLANPKDRSIVYWTFAIHYETLRGLASGSTSHSIRALYLKAEDDIGAHCPALWKQHVVFEIAEARKESAKYPSAKKPRKDGKKRKEETRVEEAYKRVKDVFFRGVTMLPWCKEFAMMAFTHLGSEFLSEEERRRVYGVLAEKELRVYVELVGGGFVAN